MLALKELIESGKVTPVIDRTYPLTEAPDAIRYVEQGTREARSSSRCNPRGRHQSRAAKAS